MPSFQTIEPIYGSVTSCLLIIALLCSNADWPAAPTVIECLYVNVCREKASLRLRSFVTVHDLDSLLVSSLAILCDRCAAFSCNNRDQDWTQQGGDHSHFSLLFSVHYAATATKRQMAEPSRTFPSPILALTTLPRHPPSFPSRLSPFIRGPDFLRQVARFPTSPARTVSDEGSVS